ncbi:MAG: dihydrodipicolinate synthase family protein [bacterium]
MNQKALVDKFGRVLIPIVTPFGDDGEVSISNLRGLCDHIRKNGLSDSIIVGGTTGEFASLTTEERLKIFEVVREAVTDQPVIAGTGAASTREAVRLTKAAEEIGMDMAMVVCPYYLRPTPQGILEHFREVAKSTRLPIMLYNIPLFTGVNLDPEVVRELVRIENIVAIGERRHIPHQHPPGDGNRC